MRIAIDSDINGSILKNIICELLKENQINFCDLDYLCTNRDQDYPDVANNLAHRVKNGEYDRGILICGTGLGMAICANKVKGVYAGACSDVYAAERLVKSNNAQILCMGAYVTGSESAKHIVLAWLKSEFQGGRSLTKVKRMAELEEESFNNKEEKNFMQKVGIQLYTVMEKANEDYFGTIKALKLMGYEGIEFPGDTFRRVDAAKLKDYLDEIQFELAGIVFEYNDFENNFPQVMEYCKVSKCKNVVFPWIDEGMRSIEGYKRIAEKFNNWGRQFKENGICFMYHIHGYEFDNLGLTTCWDLFQKYCNEEYVKLEIDVYWVQWGGIDPVKFMEQNGHRSPSIHFKDMKDSISKEDIEVGDGFIDMKRIALIGKENGANWFIVEQEAFNMPCMDSALISLLNLKKIVAGL